MCSDTHIITFYPNNGVHFVYVEFLPYNAYLSTEISLTRSVLEQLPTLFAKCKNHNHSLITIGPLGPSSPSVPLIPSMPGIPLSPSGPVAPGMPRFPGTPFSPGAPARPLLPFSPGGPALPLVPFLPSV